MLLQNIIEKDWNCKNRQLRRYEVWAQTQSMKSSFSHCRSVLIIPCRYCLRNLRYATALSGEISSPFPKWTARLQSSEDFKICPRMTYNLITILRRLYQAILKPGPSTGRGEIPGQLVKNLTNPIHSCPTASAQNKFMTELR